MQGAKKIFELKSDYNGMGNVVFAWSPDSNFIAAAGENKIVYILDRRGKKLREATLQNSNRVMSLDWDKDNEFLCILQENTNFVYLWNVFSSNNLQEMEWETKYKNTFIKWSKTHPVLVIGNEKGNLLFYNKKIQKKIPTMSKHSKKVISGDWNKEGLLITGAEDKLFTVSNYNADTVFESITVKAEPRGIQWGRQKTDDRESPQRTITAIMSNKSILMFELNSNKQPLELVFEQKYGKIVDYNLYGDGYIVVGFSEGYVAHISTHIKELKDEVSSEKVFQSTLECICTNDILYKLAVGGESTVKIYSMSNWKELKSERIDLPKSSGKISKIQWANNGQLLVVSTTNGGLYGYLTSVPTLTSVWGNFVCILSSFTEVAVIDCGKTTEGKNLTVVNLENEPAIIANGPYHIAAGINNMVWYYLWFDNSTNKPLKTKNFIMKRDYLVSVRKIVMNQAWAAVFIDGGRCILHPLQQNQESVTELEKRYPASENEKPISQMAMTDNFLILLDTYGRLKFIYLPELSVILEYKPDVIISKFFPSNNGTKLICIDNNGNSYMFFANTETLLPITNFQTKVETILWDNYEPSVFCVVDSDSVYTYCIQKNTLQGVSIAPVQELLSIDDLKKKNLSSVVTMLDKEVKPLILSNGFLHCFTPLGNVQGQYLASHSHISNWKGDDDNVEGHYRYFLQNLMLGRFSHCLEAAINLNELYLFDALGRRCLQSLEFDVAIRAFQQAGNLSMVLTIQGFKEDSEKNILLGNVAMILGEYDVAQDLFLRSSSPHLALDMRCDIQDWLIALNLAKNIAPEQEPKICRRLALQIESQGNFSEAQRLYEKAVLKLTNGLSSTEEEQHNIQCFAGIARTSIKLGDVSRGFNIAGELNDNQLILEIAMVCENMKQLLEAAQLYKKGGLPEKAASIYIALKMIKPAMELVEMIKSPKLLIQMAKVRESEGAYKEAEQLYFRAEDWENVIRTNLAYNDDYEKAKHILKTKCPTSTCASMVATAANKRGFKKESIEFLLIAEKKEEAFGVALAHGEMETFTEHLKSASSDDYLKIAQYYEGKSLWGEAGKFHEKSGNHTRALKLYIQGGEKYMDSAIQMIGHASNEHLTNTLLNYLMGITDGIPKDPIFTYKVYRILKLIKEASKIAITIAEQDQEQGNYKVAHGLLFETYKDMKDGGMVVNWDLYMKLLILHSYNIVRRVIKINEHEDAARLLNRVCKNISQFPAHAINILTTAVVEAIRANLKGIAFQWACVLVRPEYRGQIPEKYKNKIENVARKHVKDESMEISKSACPFCKEPVPDFDLNCSSCQNNIPFCIASGKHVALEDCCFCPGCNFPMNSSYMRKYIESGDNPCPMCGKELDLNDLQIDANALVKLKTSKPEQKDQPDSSEGTRK